FSLGGNEEVSRHAVAFFGRVGQLLASVAADADFLGDLYVERHFPRHLGQRAHDLLHVCQNMCPPLGPVLRRLDGMLRAVGVAVDEQLVLIRVKWRSRIHRRERREHRENAEDNDQDSRAKGHWFTPWRLWRLGIVTVRYTLCSRKKFGVRSRVA